MSCKQHGGNPTPLPRRFYDEKEQTTHTQEGGSPYSQRYFDERINGNCNNLSPNEGDFATGNYTNFFYRSNFARDTATKLSLAQSGGCCGLGRGYMRHVCPCGCGQADCPCLKQLTQSGGHGRGYMRHVCPCGCGQTNCPCLKQLEQVGSGSVGAPFTIPNYGVNQNIGHQTDPSSFKTTGFSYRFNTSNGLPQFKPVN